jgi:hypothetical protein
LEVSGESVLNSFSSLYKGIKPECAPQGLDTVIVCTLVITDWPPNCGNEHKVIND